MDFFVSYLYRLELSDSTMESTRTFKGNNDILTRKYVCKAVVNENGLLSVFVMVSSVEMLFAYRLT